MIYLVLLFLLYISFYRLVTNTGISYLRSLNCIEILNLSHTSVQNDVLSLISHMVRLRNLNVESTKTRNLESITMVKRKSPIISTLGITPNSNTLFFFFFFLVYCYCVHNSFSFSLSLISLSSTQYLN